MSMTMLRISVARETLIAFDIYDKKLGVTYFPRRPNKKPARMMYVPNAMKGIYRSGAFMSYNGGL